MRAVKRLRARLHLTKIKAFAIALPHHGIAYFGILVLQYHIKPEL